MLYHLKCFANVTFLANRYSRLDQVIQRLDYYIVQLMESVI